MHTDTGQDTKMRAYRFGSCLKYAEFKSIGWDNDNNDIKYISIHL